VKVEKDKGFSIPCRQCKNGCPYGVVGSRIAVKVDMRTRVSNAVVECLHRRWYPPQLGAVAIGGDRKQPGGESGISAPGLQPAKDTKKRFLRHVFRAAAIPAEPIGEVEERSLPPQDNSFERSDFAGKNSLDVFVIFACSHFALGNLDFAAVVGSCIFFQSGIFSQKTQPLHPPAKSYRMRWRKP
jgi:hypothetical protein